MKAPLLLEIIAHIVHALRRHQGTGREILDILPVTSD
jgi:hypothetical protein